MYLGGKSQGALLSLYIQLMKLDMPLGGIILFAGYTIHPLRELLPLSKEEAQARCTCLNGRYFIYHGTDDKIFPKNEALDKYEQLFEKLGVDNKTVYIEEGLGHSTSSAGL